MALLREMADSPGSLSLAGALAGRSALLERQLVAPAEFTTAFTGQLAFWQLPEERLMASLRRCGVI